MKRTLLFLCLSAISFFASSQQPDPKELQKLIDAAKKNAGSGKFLESTDADDAFKAPKRNNALLATIPKKAFTDAELVKYLKTLMQKFEVSPSNKKSIVLMQKNYSGKKVQDYRQVAILLWYKGHMNEGMYAALKSATSSTADLLALNNLSAFLNMSGYPHKAIPLLQYALSKSANNTSLLNNIGQAYYQLGDLSTSSDYLSNCTRIDRYHVEANNTQGHIATARGNTTVAMDFYENSIKGGYNQSAASQLGKRENGKRAEDLIDWPTFSKYPETDDNIPFSCPVIPSDVSQDPAFQAKLQEDKDALSRLIDDYNTRLNESMQQNGMALMQSMQAGSRPAVKLGLLHKKAEMAFAKAYITYFDEQNRLLTKYAAWKDEFDKRWAERKKDACLNVQSDEACCRIMRSIVTQQQQELASRYTEHCAAMWANAKGHYNCIVYWQPYFIQGPGIFQRELHTARMILLSTAESLISQAGISFEETCLDAVEPGQSTKTVNFKEPECKSIVKIPLGVGSIELGCDKFKASVGEGIIGEIELNFKTFQSTIAMGVGAQVQSGVANASVGAFHYITFDGNFNVQDYGRRVQASVGVVEVSGDLGLSALSAESTLSVGVNSGVNASTSISAFNQTLFSREVNLYSFK